MLRKTFSIYNYNEQEINLFIEIAKKHIACFSKSAEKSVLHSFEFFQFDATRNENFSQLLNGVKTHSELFAKNFQNVQIIWNNEECICVPAEFYNETISSDYFNLVFGETDNCHLFSKNLNELQVAARIPLAMQQSVTDIFPTAEFAHQYYMLLNEDIKNDKNRSGSQIQILFYPDYFVVFAKSNSQLMLIQTREYSVPEDVLYFLLNICEQYELPVNETKIIASGMIDAKSKLYNKLYEYFSGFEIATADEALFVSDSFKEFPLHFFLPFANYEIV